MRTVTWTVIATLLVAGFLAGAGALAFVFSGIYPIAASRPHTLFSRLLLTTMMVHAVKRNAAGIRAPRLDDPELIRRGILQYHTDCEICHGAPGVAAAQLGRGINPDPPRLVKVAAKWSDGEIYWIVRNGMKMSGMPSMGAGKSERDLWALVAFVRRMAWLAPAEYARMLAAAEGDTAAAAGVAWLPRDDMGFRLLRARGRADRGRHWIAQFSCGACHTIPGIDGAAGKVGPPLEDFAERHYVGGEIVNTPNNLVAWLLNPRAIEPATVMPAVGLTQAQALDVAAYLYTLGKPMALGPPFPPRP